MASAQSRHELLRNLGVGQWYTKYTLPNTPATPRELLSTDLLNHDAAISNSDVSLVDGSQAELQSLNVVMSDLAALAPATGSPKEPEQLPKELQPSLNSLAVGSLSLVMVRFEGLLICYESVGDDSGGLHSERALLLSIVKSIYPDLNDFDGLGGCSSFVWPPFLSDSLLHNQSAYFELNLKRWFVSHNLNDVKQLVYFGMSFNQVEGVVLELRSEIESDFIMLPFALSLSELLGVPVKKKSLWSLLAKVGVAGG